MSLILNPTKTTLLAALLFFSACAPAGFAPTTEVADTEYSEQDAAATEAPLDVDAKAQEVLQMAVPELTPAQTAKVLSKYSHLDPKHLIPDVLLEKAVTYFDANITRFENRTYMGVYDYSKKSTLTRFFIVNLKTGEVQAYRSAHGTGSDSNHDGFAEKFSNSVGSNASSLGYAKTVETYISGKFGYALRMQGLSTTNSNLYKRAVVIHGANYVRDAAVVQGRSYGCPAVSFANRDKVVNQLKGGALIYFGLSK